MKTFFWSVKNKCDLRMKFVYCWIMFWYQHTKHAMMSSSCSAYHDVMNMLRQFNNLLPCYINSYKSRSFFRNQ